MGLQNRMNETRRLSRLVCTFLLGRINLREHARLYDTCARDRRQINSSIEISSHPSTKCLLYVPPTPIRSTDLSIPIVYLTCDEDFEHRRLL